MSRDSALDGIHEFVRSSFGLFLNDPVENAEMVPDAQFVMPGHGNSMEDVRFVAIREDFATSIIETDRVKDTLNFVDGIAGVVFQPGNDGTGARESPCPAEVFHRLVLFLVVVELDAVEELLEEGGKFAVIVDLRVPGSRPFPL